jgi:hypothetical protein
MTSHELINILTNVTEDGRITPEEQAAFTVLIDKARQREADDLKRRKDRAVKSLEWCLHGDSVKLSSLVHYLGEAGIQVTDDALEAPPKPDLCLKECGITVTGLPLDQKPAPPEPGLWASLRRWLW